MDVIGDELVVQLRDGEERRYEKRVLVYMLVKIYSIDVQKARQMCFGFGLDPRPRPRQRMMSCSCGGKMEDVFHKFPKGFTFAVRDKYEQFARECPRDFH